MATRKKKPSIPPNLEVEALKEAYREAMKEWLDEQFTKFGRWSFFALLSAGFAALVYFILVINGWHPPTR